MWGISSDRSKLVFSIKGETVEPNALEIYDAEFGDAPVLLGQKAPRPSRSLEKVSFSEEVLGVQPKLILAKSSRAPKLVLSVIGRKDFFLYDKPTHGYAFDGSSWGFLDAAQTEETISTLEELGLELNQELTGAELAGVALKFAPNSPENELFDAEVASQIRANNLQDEFDGALIKAKLYEYQAAGGAYLASMARANLGVLLADEMGLGKTIQVIYTISAGVAAGRTNNVVVAPASLLLNWSRELHKFAPQLSSHIHRGSLRTGRPKVLESFDVILVSYETLVADQYLFRTIKWDVVALDEAQNIKNQGAQRTQAAKSLSRGASIAVTGTPIETSLTNAHSIMEFVSEGRLGTLDAFKARFPDSMSSAADLAKFLAPFTIRRTVEQVGADLPERVDIPRPIEMSRFDAASYAGILAGADSQLAKLMKLRQLCTSPSFMDPALSPSSNKKLDLLGEILGSAFSEGQKVLLFTPFTHSINELTGFVATRFPGTFVERIFGEVVIENRQEIIDRFTGYEGPGALVMNPKAAGVGLNIQAANHVIHFSPDWNPAVIDQASARAHRTGQQLPVFVHYLYFIDTVEEIMMNRLADRRDLAKAGLSAAMDTPNQTELALALSVSPRVSDDNDD